jgi:NAD(P)-dependent dehydrogenase (short-subunit alcohol dehydrogenase family)
MQQPFSLQGRVALITGGGTGIGFDIAKCFLASGATVVITGRREDVLKEAVANLGAGAHYAVNDVSDLSLTAQLVSDLVARHGAIDILLRI